MVSVKNIFDWTVTQSVTILETHENITHANYNRRFMNLSRPDQTSSGNSIQAIKYEVAAAPTRTIVGSELDMGVGAGIPCPPAKEAGVTVVAPGSVKDVCVLSFISRFFNTD